MLVAAAMLAGAPAQAQTKRAVDDQSVDALRAQADAIATSYFAALARSQQLDEQITESEHLVETLEAQAAAARAAATARAVAAYRSSGSRLSAVVDSSDLLDATRRARLVDEVNRRDHESYAQLRRTSADLKLERKTLEDDRAAQAAAVADLKDQGAAIDAKLAAAQRAAAAQAAAAAATAAANAASVAKASVAAAVPSPSPGVAATAPTVNKPVAPPSYTGTSGTNEHHDDPFLTCLRRRESGGNYSVVSGAGYLGAYQFGQSTWNVTASHAGRAELVGVPANVASPYDQDAMAWALYQWQGEGPWGGCS